MPDQALCLGHLSHPGQSTTLMLEMFAGEIADLCLLVMKTCSSQASNPPVMQSHLHLSTTSQ